MAKPTDKDFEWTEIKDGASICIDKIWTKWPVAYKHLKMPCRVAGPIRKRTRMKLTGFMPDYRGYKREVLILAWFSDLLPIY